MWGAHPEIVDRNKAVAQRLRLGSQTGINFSNVGKTFSWKTPANQVAMCLFLLKKALGRARIHDWGVYEWLVVLSFVGRFDVLAALRMTRNNCET